MFIESQAAYIAPTDNNMFTLRVLVGTSRGQVRPHHFTGCDHRQDGQLNGSGSATS